MLEAVTDVQAFEGGIYHQMARTIHESYVKTELSKPDSTAVPGSLLPWPDLSRELRTQNIDQASEYGRILGKHGMKIAPCFSLIDEEIISFSDPEIEILAELEHNRWWKRKQLEGWRPGDPDMPQDPKEKTHPSMRPYHELPRHEQQKDRDIVCNLPTLLATISCIIVRSDIASE